MKTHSLRNVIAALATAALMAATVGVLARARRAFVELPSLMRAGLGLAVVGAVIDIGHHIGTDAPGMGHGSVAFIGHTVTLVGMVVTMLGLIGAALKRRPVEAKPTQEGESR